MMTPDFSEKFDKIFTDVGISSYSPEHHILAIVIIFSITTLLLLLVTKINGGDKDSMLRVIVYAFLGIVLMLPVFTIPVGLYFIFMSLKTSLTPK